MSEKKDIDFTYTVKPIGQQKKKQKAFDPDAAATDEKKAFGAWLRRELAEANKKQIELVTALGSSASLVNRYVMGESYPRLNRIREIEVFLQIPPERCWSRAIMPQEDVKKISEGRERLAHMVKHVLSEEQVAKLEDYAAFLLLQEQCENADPVAGKYPKLSDLLGKL